jgi:hypothetical protein
MLKKLLSINKEINIYILVHIFTHVQNPCVSQIYGKLYAQISYQIRLVNNIIIVILLCHIRRLNFYIKKNQLIRI